MERIFLDKRGQVAKTITWIVATIIIIVILGITFFVVEFSPVGNKDVSQTRQVDTLVSKSFFSYLLTDDVYGKIESFPEGLDKETGDLAQNIFEGLYGKEYTKDIWLGILFDFDLSGEENEFFGKKPKTSGGGGKVSQIFVHVSEKVKLNEEKSFGFILLKHGVESYF